jgi:hypothetical protein
VSARETIRLALAQGRATAIAQAIAGEPPPHTLASEVAQAKEPFDSALDALDALAQAFGAYRSAVLSGEPESDQLRALAGRVLSGAANSHPEPK